MNRPPAVPAPVSPPRRFSLRLLLAVALPIGASSGCHQGSAPTVQASSVAESDVRVVPISPVRKSLVRYCEQPGRVAAFETAPLHAKVAGYVRKVHVDLGDRVRGPVERPNGEFEPGQLLVELDVPELEKELAQKAAVVEQVRAEIVQAESAVRVAEAMRESAGAKTAEAEAAVERCEAELSRWKSELARMTELAARQAVTEKLLDETRSKHDASAAMRKEAKAKLASTHAERAEADASVAKATADVGATKAKLNAAVADQERLQTLVGFREIRAPFDGVVAARHVDTGRLVQAGGGAEPMLVIVDSRVVRVSVDVPEIDAVPIRPGAEVTLRLPSLGPAGVPGKVARTTWVLNDATRTLRTEIDLPNEDGRLRPGMYAHARVKVAERSDVLVLPKSAVLTDAGQAYCWKIGSDSTLVRQSLEPGLEADGEVEIISGLTGDERIIGVNAAAFREGQRVAPAAPTPPPPAPAPPPRKS